MDIQRLPPALPPVSSDPVELPVQHRVVMRPAPYAPYISHAHWNASHRAMQRALTALPVSVAWASLYGGATAVVSTSMALAAAAYGLVGVGTVVLAPACIPSAVALGVAAGTVVVVGSAMTLYTLTSGLARAAYAGATAVGHAACALTDELGLSGS